MATVRLQLRRGLADDWFDANPTLAAGEIGIETDTNTFKFGDGNTPWNDLEYALSGTVDDYIALSTKGVANGVASLDGAGLIPLAQLPGAAALDAEVSTAITNHNNATTSVHGIANTSLLATTANVATAKSEAIAAAEQYADSAISVLTSASPESLNTLNELAAALGDDANFAGTVTNSLAEKAPIASPTFTGTVTLPESTSIGNVSNLEIGYLNGVTSGVQTQIDAKAPLASPTLTGTVTLPESTSIGNVSNLEIGYLNGVSSSIQTQIDDKLEISTATSTYAPLASPTLTGTVTLPESTAIGNVTSLEIGYLNGVTSGVQSQLDAKAPLESPTLTGTVTLPESTSIGNVSNLEIGYLSGVTSGVQTQLDAKAPLESPTLTGTVTLPEATSIGNVSNLEIGYLNGVTSGVQTQIDAKAPLASPTLTGTVTLPESTSIGNVSNLEIGYLNGVTSGIQTQLDDKAPLESPTFTGTVTLPANTISQSMMGDDSVGTNEIGGFAVTEAKLAVNSVTESKIADGAVTSAKIATGTIVNEDISTSAAIAQSKIDGLSTSFGLKADLSSPTFTGTVVLPTVTAGGSIVPTTDNTFDLGSPTNMWKDIYVGPGSLYVNGQKVLQDESGAIVVSADINENLGLRTSGSGNIELDPTGTGSVNIKGPLVVEAGANFSSADGNGITFSNGVKTDSLSSKSADTDLSLSGNGTGKVYINDNAEVNGNFVIGGNLTVSGTTTTVNSETISLADNIIDLNSNLTTGSPTENAGVRVVRGDSNAVQLRWNESSDVWEFTNDGSSYSPVAPLASPTFTGTVTIPAGASISGFAPLASPTFTGTVTVAANGVAFTDGTQTKAGVPSLTVIGTEISADYNLSTGGLGLRDQLIPIAGTRAITIPTNATLAFPIGGSIDFYQASGTGANFVAADGTVTILRTPGLKLRTTYSSATLTKVALNTWLLAGDLTA